MKDLRVLLEQVEPPQRRPVVVAAAGVLLLVPALHPLVRPIVGTPSHLLWFAHVLPVALVTYAFGLWGATLSVALSVAGVAAGEWLFGAGYGQSADQATILALSTAVGFTDVLIAGFALAVRAEKARRRHLREQFGAALDASPEAVLLLDGGQCIQYANAAARAAFGSRPNELAGRPFEELLSAGSRQDGAPLLARAQQQSGSSCLIDVDTGAPLLGRAREQPVQVVAVRLDGRPFAAELSASEAKSASGGVAAYLVTVRDQSQRLLKDQAQRRTQTLAEVGAVVAGIAHELNNPLAAILSYADVVKEEPALPPDVAEEIEVINREAHRAAGIARQLLGLVRHGERPREPADGSRLVERALRARATSLAAHGIRVVTDLGQSLPPINVVSGEIEQVLANLLTNAEYAMHAANGKGLLTVSTRASGGFVEITVADDGPGMAREHLTRLFEAFFTTKPVGSGTGLGLSIARRIAREHGGDLSVASKLGAGSAFTLSLPVAAASGAPRRSGERPAAPTTAGGGKRILVVDDEASIRRAVERLLTRRGYYVTAVGNARDAKAAVARGDFDLVFCDVHLNGDSGLDVYRAAVALQPALGCRFVFMSGDIMSQELRESLAASGSGYLLKPFETADLLREAQRAGCDLREQAPSAAHA